MRFTSFSTVALLGCVVFALLAPVVARGQSTAQGLLGLSAEEIDALRTRALQSGRNGSTPSPLDQARERAAAPADSTSRIPGTLLPGSTLLPAQATAAAPPPPPPSALERDFSARAGQTLTLFGYEIFASAVPVQEPFTGSIPDGYVLGIGDELVVTLQGQTSETLTTRVDREGRVLLPGVPPVPAAGRSFGEFRTDLEARVRAARIGTEVFVSVGSLRLIRVVVAGEVQRAGVQSLTGLSTPLEALLAAGGVRKTGSLRRIQVKRGNAVLQVDLYDLLVHGNLRDQLPLMDGDMVVVPTLGPTVAVAGDVGRPAIFELLPGAAPPPLSALIEWAGGPLRPSGNRILQVSLDRRGEDQVRDRSANRAVAAQEGDVILVQASGMKYGGSVFLTGHVRAPGLRSLASAPTLSRLIPDISTVRDDPYLLFGVISRIDPRTGARSLQAVDLAAVLARTADVSLKADDVVIVPSAEDVLFLVSNDVLRLLTGQRPPRTLIDTGEDEGAGLVEELVAARANGGAPLQQQAPVTNTRGLLQPPTLAGAEGLLQPPTLTAPAQPSAPVCRGLTELAALVSADRAGRFATALRGLVEQQGGESPLQMTCPELFNQQPSLLRFMLEHAVAVSGEVRTPGVYPVRPGAALESVLAYAGGLRREADQTNIEVTRFDVDSRQGTSRVYRETVDLRRLEAVAVRPGDVVRLNAVFSDRDTGPVVLSGEFIRPGVYNIRRGERLSEIIERAGGLTEQAYPYGVVFTRERVKREEQANFRRYIRELQSGMATAAAKTRGKVEAAGMVEAVQNLIKVLAQTRPVGRVVVEADPTVLQVRPEEDTILEPGDTVLIPKRPNYVTITGEVLNTGAVAFKTGATASDYVQMAGGFADAADDDRTFVVRPNGSAQPVSVSAWNFSPTQIPPGSTIVVPRDPLPFDWLLLTTDITGIIRDLAVSAASLAVIGNTSN